MRNRAGMSLALCALAAAPAAAASRRAPSGILGDDGSLPPLLVPAHVPGRRFPVADATTQDEEIEALRRSGLDWKEIREFLESEGPLDRSAGETDADAARRGRPAPLEPRKSEPAAFLK